MVSVGGYAGAVPDTTDTIYSPPIDATDLITLQISEGSNEIGDGFNNCPLFYEDPLLAVQDPSKVEVRPVKVFYKGDSLPAYEVDPYPCIWGQIADYQPHPGAIGPSPLANIPSTSPACLMEPGWRLCG